MPCAQLDLKQVYTQFGGTWSAIQPFSTPLIPIDRPLVSVLTLLCFLSLSGLRPFGVSLLYGGWDPHYEFQLSHSDPSGNYSGWKATCIGANSGTAQSLLKQDYKDDITIEDAITLVLKTMSKTMDSTTLGSEKCKCYDVCHIIVINDRWAISGIRYSYPRCCDENSCCENLSSGGN